MAARSGRGRGYRELLAWQRGMDFVEAVYQASERWPSREQFGLAEQVRRAAVSIPANIAEGHGRTDPKEYLHHCSIANGSLCEVETHLLLAHRLSYLDETSCNDLLDRADEISRLLIGLIKHLRTVSASQR